MNIEIIEDEGKLKVYFPHDKNISEIKNILERLRKGDIEVVRTDRLSLDQSKLIWVLCKEYGDLIGYSREEMREVLQNEFCSKKGIEYFSISTMKKDNCSKEIATEFIQFIIEHSIEQGFNLLIYEGYGENKKVRNLRSVVPDIQRMIIAKLRTKSCIICGVHADLHHEPSLGTDYDLDDGLQTGFLPLCRYHHSERHNMSWEDFKKKWHVDNVWLNPNLIIELKKVYPGHFKAFDIKKYKKELTLDVKYIS